jgi:hypothetical protein
MVAEVARGGTRKLETFGGHRSGNRTRATDILRTQ